MFAVVHRVHNPVATLPNAIALLSVQLLATRRPRVLGQSPDPARDALTILFDGYGFELFDG